VQQQLEIAASPRDERGKNSARRTRAAGRVPGVLYGLEKDPVAISLDTKTITKLLASPSGHNQVLSLKVDGGETAAAMAADWQVEPVRGKLLHVDMKRVDLTRTVTVNVRVATVGVSTGVKEHGGHEEMVAREVEVECLPYDVPEKIEIDISPLMIGQAVHVGDLPVNEKYRILTNAHQVLVHIVSPKAEVEVAPVEEAAVVAEAAPAAEPAKAEKGGKPEKGGKSEKGGKN
jgi:large subunit ribosomal protein L25